jgi:hypothetical protein
MDYVAAMKEAYMGLLGQLLSIFGTSRCERVFCLVGGVVRRQGPRIPSLRKDIMR